MYLCFWQWEPAQRRHRFVTRETSRTEYDARNAVTRIWLIADAAEPLLLTEEKRPRLILSPSSSSSSRAMRAAVAPFLCRSDEIKRTRQHQHALTEDERDLLGLLR